MIIFGSRLYGRVDRLSNGWFVATQFAHVYCVPLVPAGTYLVTGESGRRWNGIKIPISGRSVLMGYARAGAIVGSVIALVAAIGSFDGRHAMPQEVIAVAIAVSAIAAVIFTNLAWRKASQDRELALIRLVEAKAISGQLPAARGFDVIPTDVPVAIPVEPPPLPK